MSTSIVSVEENKAVARRWNEEGVNGRNLDLVYELFHPDYAQRSGTEGPWSVTVQGLEAAKAGFEQVGRGFPTARIAIEDLFGEGDKVALRVTLYIDENPAGNGNIIYRFVDGKIIDDWYCWTYFPGVLPT